MIEEKDLNGRRVSCIKIEPPEIMNLSLKPVHIMYKIRN